MVAESENVVTIELGPIFELPAPFLHRIWAQFENSWSYEIADLTNVFFVNFTLGFAIFRKIFKRLKIAEKA